MCPKLRVFAWCRLNDRSDKMLMRSLQGGHTLTRTHVVTISLLVHVLLPYSWIFISARRAPTPIPCLSSAECWCVSATPPCFFFMSAYLNSSRVHNVVSASQLAVLCFFCVVVLDWVHMLTYTHNHCVPLEVKQWRPLARVYFRGSCPNIYIHITHMHASVHKTSASSGGLRICFVVSTVEHAIWVNRRNQEPNNLAVSVFQFFVWYACMLCVVGGCECGISMCVGKQKAGRFTLQIWYNVQSSRHIVTAEKLYFRGTFGWKYYIDIL